MRFLKHDGSIIELAIPSWDDANLVPIEEETTSDSEEGSDSWSFRVSIN